MHAEDVLLVVTIGVVTAAAVSPRPDSTRQRLAFGARAAAIAAGAALLIAGSGAVLPGVVRQILGGAAFIACALGANAAMFGLATGRTPVFGRRAPGRTGALRVLGLSFALAAVAAAVAGMG
jgi:hypothetical protein